MKITAVRVLKVWDTPFSSTQTMMEVSTSEGLTGYAIVDLSDSFVIAVINELSPLLLGAQALEIEPLCTRMLTAWPGSAAVHRVIAALELALWDLFGLYVELPVTTLLGGRQRAQVDACIDLELDSSEPFKARVAALKLEHCQALRLHGGSLGLQSTREDERLMEQAISQCQGDARIIVAAPLARARDPKWVRRTADMLDALGVERFEVPFAPRDISLFKWLNEISRIDIGMVQAPLDRAEGRALLAAAAVDWLTVDCLRCGGIHNAAWLIRTAQSFGVRVSLAGARDAISLAADMHLSSLLESRPLLNLPLPNRLGALLEPTLSLDAQGRLTIPTGDGLGVRPRDEAFFNDQLCSVH